MSQIIFNRFASNAHATARNTTRTYIRYNECSSVYSNSGLSSGMLKRTYIFDHNTRTCLKTWRQNISPICSRLHTGSTETRGSYLLRVPEYHSAATVAQRHSLRNTDADVKIVYSLSEDNLGKLFNCMPTNECPMANVQVFYHLKNDPNSKPCDVPSADTEYETKFNTSWCKNAPESTFKMYSEISKILEDGLNLFQTDLDKSPISIDVQTLYNTYNICDQKWILSIYSPIMKPALNEVAKYIAALNPDKYSYIFKRVKYPSIMKLVKDSMTLKQLKYNMTLKPVKYNPTLEPVKYNPTLNHVKYSPTMKHIVYEETLRPVKYNPTLNQGKHNSTLEPAKYNPTLNHVKYNPTMKHIAYKETLRPVKYNPTLNQGKYNPTLNQGKHNSTLEPAKYNPTLNHVKYNPTMKHIAYEETLRPVKYNPTLNQVKYIPTMKQCIPALRSTIYGSNFKTTARTPSVKNTIFSLTSVRGVQSLAPDIPSVTVFDMKRTLKQSGLPLVDGYTALAVKCMLCNAADDGTMYINKTTGYFICPKCQNHGDWGVLQRVLKKGAAEEGLREHFQRIQEERRAFQLSWRKLLEETTPLSKLSAEDAETLFRLFEYPYFEDGAKVLGEVRCDASRTALVFPLKNSVGAVVGYRAVRAGDEQRPETCGGHAAGLFTCKLGRSERAVLTPTVADLLCLARDKVPGCLVWWHAGLLPPSVLPVLENFKRVCIWGGGENIRGVGDKLDHERCRFVRAIDGATTPSEAAEAGAAAGRLRAAVADAAPAAHRSITTFRALRDDVYANITNAEKVRGVKWSRFPALSRLLGGHRRGELTVLTGATGCGKTTLTAEMSLDLAASGVNTLWGSFEIRNSRLAQTMLQQHAGVPLEQHLSEFHALADQFQLLPIYFLAFHGPQPIGTVMEAVEHARYVYDIAHVIIDNVQFMLGVGGGGGGGAGGEHSSGERFFKQDAVVAAFRTFATRRDCHVTLVMHPRKERDAEDLSTSSIFGSAKASQEADNVLIIQDKRLTAVRGKKYLQVAKNRFSGDLGIVPLEFDKSALSYRAKKRTKDNKDDKDGYRLDEEGQRQDSAEHRQHGEQEDCRRGSVLQKDGEAESYLSEVLQLDKDK